MSDASGSVPRELRENAAFVWVLSRSSWLWITIGVLVVLSTIHLRLLSPLGFDEAFNLQVASSIAHSFTYATTYAPSVTLNPAITTNGIPQYVAALFLLLTRDPQTTVAIVCAMAIALVLVGAYLLRPWLAGVVALLYFFWAPFFYVAIAYVGEAWAIGFILIALGLLQRGFSRGDLFERTNRGHLIAVVALFGLAVSAKLFAVVAIAPVLFGLFWQDAKRRGVTSLDALWRSLIYVVIVTASSVAVMVAALLLSVLHSARDLGSFASAPSAVVTFLNHQLFLGRTDRAGGELSLVARSAEMGYGVLFLLALSSAALLRRSIAYGFLVLLILTAWLVFAFSPRQLLPLISITIILGLYVGQDAWSKFLGRWRITRMTASLVGGTAITCCFLLLCSMQHIGFLGPTIEREAAVLPPSRTIQTSQGVLAYSDGLVNALRDQRYVVTSGWWQFPSLSLEQHLQFYDRVNPANAYLNRHSDVALLFDQGIRYWPFTSIAANCGPLIYRDGPLVLCRYKNGVPLNFQPPAPQ